MADESLFLLFVRRLNDAAIDYSVTGSVAAIIYGEPRLTHDVDLVVRLPPSDAPKIQAAFPDALFYCPPQEVVRVEASRDQRGHFNLIDHATGFKADVYLAGRDPLQRWALRESRTVELDGIPVRVAPPEYVILRKLEYYREGKSEKHVRDICGMLRQSAASIDLGFLRDLIADGGLGEQWATVRAECDDED
jgi:hypothetical protein